MSSSHGRVCFSPPRLISPDRNGRNGRRPCARGERLEQIEEGLLEVRDGWEVPPLEAVIVITRGWAALVAFAALILLLTLAHVLIVAAPAPNPTEKRVDNVAKRRRGVKALMIGADGRASTSKVQAVLWTFSVLYGFVFLLAWGRSLGCDGTGLTQDETATCTAAAEGRSTFAQVVGRDLQADYYVLLGFPLGVAVAAKALTTSKVAAGTITKSANEESSGVVQGLRETISNDRGETDLLDFQYFTFNLLTLAFFWTEFMARPNQGLPDIPATLIGLSGLSAAAYTTKKALETDVRPGIASVIPHRVTAAAGTPVAIIGTGFGDREVVDVPAGQIDIPASVSPPAWVRIDGIPLQIERWAPTRIDAVLSAEVAQMHPVAGGRSVTGELVIDVEEGPPSEPFSIELAPPSDEQRPPQEAPR